MDFNFKNKTCLIMSWDEWQLRNRSQEKMVKDGLNNVKFMYPIIKIYKTRILIIHGFLFGENGQKIRMKKTEEKKNQMKNKIMVGFWVARRDRPKSSA